ncbi:MAG: hypothetical protein RL172_2081 [Bacteroidota bacterium]|jgi:hypothetical protein
MKKISLIISFLSLFFGAKAQEETQLPAGKNREDIEALKVAFISKELELTPEEAQKFWPVYNQYSKEVNTALLQNEDVIQREEKVVNIRKHYRDQFTKVLGQQRMNRMFNAEGKFRQILIKALQRQRQRNNKIDRPLQQRRGF